MGCSRVTSLPPGKVDLILCDRAPANTSLLPLAVKMNGVLSYTGAERTGSEIKHALSAMNVFVCSGLHKSLSLNIHMIC